MQDQFDKLMESKISSGQEKKLDAPPKRKPPRRGRRIALKLVLALCLVVLLICGAAVWGYTLSVNGRNLPQVYVNGVFVGNMTPEETEAALRQAKWDALEGESLSVSLPAGAGFTVDYLLFSLLAFLTGWTLFANVAARFVSAGVNFSVNRWLVFQDKGPFWRSAAQYFALAAGILAARREAASSY